eukprot:PhF_6_TR43631/c0_g1_i1/m.67032
MHSRSSLSRRFQKRVLLICVLFIGLFPLITFLLTTRREPRGSPPPSFSPGAPLSQSVNISSSTQIKRSVAPRTINCLRFQLDRYPPLLCHLRGNRAPNLVKGLIQYFSSKTQLFGMEFYRNEDVPSNGGDGPPYSLLQGRLTAEAFTLPSAGGQLPELLSPLNRNTIVRGDVAHISNGDFFIALANHDAWASSFTVFGALDQASLRSVTRMVQSEPYENVTHSTGTVMRMMRQPVKIVNISLT